MLSLGRKTLLTLLARPVGKARRDSLTIASPRSSIPMFMTPG